jgi:hypothetical protein
MTQIAINQIILCAHGIVADPFSSISMRFFATKLKQHAGRRKRRMKTVNGQGDGPDGTPTPTSRTAATSHGSHKNKTARVLLTQLIKCKM